MTAISPVKTETVRVRPSAVRPRPAGFLRDLAAVATRSLRQARREPGAFVQSMFVPFFFFAIFVGSLESLLAPVGVENFRAFQLPVAIVIAVTGLTRATSVVDDINSGYFDRMLLAPMNRQAILLGVMVADLVMVMLMTVPVLALGFAVGVEFTTGPLGVLAFVALAAAWALAYVGVLYAVAIRTGNATVTAQAFMLFFPFVFLTTTIVPQEQMSGWLSTAADVNPLTYVYAALRSLISQGWDGAAIGKALIAIAIVGLVTHTLAHLALRGRVSRG